MVYETTQATYSMKVYNELQVVRKHRRGYDGTKIQKVMTVHETMEAMTVHYKRYDGMDDTKATMV